MARLDSAERRQILSYDRIVKLRAWRTLLLVNPRSDAEVNGLLAFCPQLKITLVWDPAWLPPRAAPSEPLRRSAVLARLLVTAGANPRLRICQGEPWLIAAKLAGERFSGAIIPQLNLDCEHSLLAQLRAWAALVEPAGALIGRGIDAAFRLELAQGKVTWRPWHNNLWLIDAKVLVPEHVEVARTQPVWQTLERNLGINP
jgi:hypothetical protein